MIPLSLMSAANSGGVFSSRFLVAITICSMHESSASNISVEDTLIVTGRNVI